MQYRWNAGENNRTDNDNRPFACAMARRVAATSSASDVRRAPNGGDSHRSVFGKGDGLAPARPIAEGALGEDDGHGRQCLHAHSVFLRVMYCGNCRAKRQLKSHAVAALPIILAVLLARNPQVPP